MHVSVHNTLHFETSQLLHSSLSPEGPLFLIFLKSELHWKEVIATHFTVLFTLEREVNVQW